ncbi:hypothetical protein QJS66_16550 [Kocuria rhizophila]|nr:hypothetical protein QJS66_16550 [Kocuria rhizophila]
MSPNAPPPTTPSPHPGVASRLRPRDPAGRVRGRVQPLRLRRHVHGGCCPSTWGFPVATDHHVESKEEILGRPWTAPWTPLEAVFAEVLASDSGPVVKLERILDGSVRVLVAQMPYVTLLLRLRGNSELRQEAALQRRRTLTPQPGGPGA